MKAFPAAIALSLLLPAPALAEGRAWTGYAIDGGASLIYGTPDTDDAPLSLSCENGSSELSFAYEFEPSNTAEAIDVILEAGDLRTRIAAQVEYFEETDQYLLLGQTTLDDDLRSLLASSGTLQVIAGGNTDEYPLAGAADAAKDLMATCRKPKG